jgi:CelD/BcsL family acetyltransferase involved in cellulose biosynthesis
MGSGISDYLDPVVTESYEHAIVEYLSEYLAANNEWDVCDWQDLSYDTSFAALSGDAWEIEKVEDMQCSEIALDGSFDQFWRQRPRHVRRNVRRYGDRARQNGPLDFQVSSEADARLIRTLITLHAERWSARGEPGMIEANHSAQFLVDVAQRFAAKDMLRVFSLNYQGEIAAIHLVFLYRNTIYGYLTGFNPAYGQLALGSLLLGEALQECYRQGFHSWNFCRGDEPYKSDWGAQPIRRCRLLLSRKRS